MIETATAPPPAMTREPALTAKGLCILIVDDNRDAAGMLAMLLQFSHIKRTWPTTVWKRWKRRRDFNRT